jgi:hypothetical protein
MILQAHPYAYDIVLTSNQFKIDAIMSNMRKLTLKLTKHTEKLIIY